MLASGMRGGGRPAAGGDERDEGLAGGRAHARLGMARGRRLDGVAFHGEQGAVVGPTELSAPRPVALATASITGFLFFGVKKLGTKLGQEVSRRRGILI